MIRSVVPGPTASRAANRLTGARRPLGWGDGGRVEPQIHQEPAETGQRGGDTADGVQRGPTLRSDGEYNRASLGGCGGVGVKMVEAVGASSPVGEENDAGISTGVVFCPRRNRKASHLEPD